MWDETVNNVNNKAKCDSCLLWNILIRRWIIAYLGLLHVEGIFLLLVNISFGLFFSVKKKIWVFVPNML